LLMPIYFSCWRIQDLATFWSVLIWKKKSTRIKNQTLKDKVKNPVFLEENIMVFEKKQKFYQCIFALRAFLNLFFKHPNKKGLFWDYSAGIFCVFFIVFMENVKSLNNYQRVFALTEKNGFEKIVKFYQRVFALTRFSIFVMKKNIQWAEPF